MLLRNYFQIRDGDIRASVARRPRNGVQGHGLMKSEVRDFVFGSVLLAVVLMTVWSGSILASNMAFKLKKSLATGFLAAQAPRGDNWISLPYISPWPKAKDLCSARFANSFTVSISKLDPVSGSSTSFNCGMAASSPANFLLMDVPRGIRIRITSSTPNEISLVGSHDGAQPLPTIYGGFLAAEAPKRDNWISVPYHSTWATAEDVCASLGLTTFQASISRLDAVSGSSQTHPCGNTTVNNFALVLGEAIRIRKTSQGDIVGVIPPHR